ncbi:MAG: PfkB family carbohydrate kinase [Spirochaetia bacterium]|nr:PfkB family carbohydrate kinase [Spirochaetia bacterium]
MSLVIVGSMAFDTIETPSEKKERVIGGACIYASLAAAFFDRPSIVGVVGTDFTDEHIKILTDRGIDTLGVERAAGKSFFWAGKYHPDMKGRDTITTELNVFESFNPALPEKYTKIPYLFLANIDPVLQLKVLNSMKNTKFTMIDTMDLWINIKKQELNEVFKKVDCVVLNDEEIAQFTGLKDELSGAQAIMKLGPKYVIIKKGEYGSCIYGHSGMYFELPSYPVKKVADPTGAGDSFAGAFMGYLSMADRTDTEAMKKALVYGNTVASFTVEDFSIDGLLNHEKKDVEARFVQLCGMTGF